MATNHKTESSQKSVSQPGAVKFLLPSEIHFFSRVRNWSELASEERLTSIDLTDYAKRLMSHDSSYPKLQVAYLNGRWFALNSLQLAICRHLERSGYCRRIRVNVCSPHALPEQVAAGLQVRGSRARGPTTSSEVGDAVSAASSSSDSTGSDMNQDDSADSCSEAEGDSQDDDGDKDADGQDQSDGSCSGSDSYCSECEREARDAAAAAAAKKETVGKPAAVQKRAGAPETERAGSKTAHRRGSTDKSQTAHAVSNSALAKSSKLPHGSKESLDTEPSLDRDLADLGPTTAMLLQQLNIKEAAAAAAAAALRDRDYERLALL